MFASLFGDLGLAVIEVRRGVPIAAAAEVAAEIQAGVIENGEAFGVAIEEAGVIGKEVAEGFDFGERIDEAIDGLAVGAAEVDDGGGVDGPDGVAGGGQGVAFGATGGGGGGAGRIGRGDVGVITRNATEDFPFIVDVPIGAVGPVVVVVNAGEGETVVVDLGGVIAGTIGCPDILKETEGNGVHLRAGDDVADEGHPGDRGAVDLGGEGIVDGLESDYAGVQRQGFREVAGAFEQLPGSIHNPLPHRT